MSITKQTVINTYLPDQPLPGTHAEAFAPSNIALCKYWGKRDVELNLPINGSLSISLGELGSRTEITESETGADQVYLNHELQAEDNSFARKVIAFINLFRGELNQPVCVKTINNIPTAAGLASSASGFAALTLAINDFYNLGLSDDKLSAFARMGSGSASRSIYQGFVEWHKGVRDDGMDSCAERLDITWPGFRIGLLKVATGAKKVDSRSGMQRTVESADLYQSWPQQAANDLATIKRAIADRDLELLGQTAEQNALSMHATMIASWPPLLYWQPESVAAMHRVWELRALGVPVYLTMDAGPNLKLLFHSEYEAQVRNAFPELLDLDIVAPFG
ncbi:diphosphomevalonate decarboxylase [Neptuniibacter sp.]|uniref:diphosphomevalonate decarboxylase n=1 Tax=Neptuniibacter sp. TaxID=1962643 RepID=UPI0026217F44|nr:diphosphomevalonate decarboxylase [Neptuniibacter sp.]MCP4596951.1 diphosphomevalonate decarboxylase [Neptuniibacter sp.]